jgi:hypothetical protein
MLKVLTSNSSSSSSTWNFWSLRKEDLFTLNTCGSFKVKKEATKWVERFLYGGALQASSQFKPTIFIEMLVAICGALNYFLVATKVAIVQGVKEGCNKFQS